MEITASILMNENNNLYTDTIDELRRKIKGGVYLVVDPYEGIDKVLPNVNAALAGGVDVLQIWNHWHEGQNQKAFIEGIIQLAHATDVPVLINEEWHWLESTRMDGVHFDAIPGGWDTIRKTIQRPFLAGITCGNDEARIGWAIRHADYLSFCSMFPSASAGACEIVRPEIVEETRRQTNLPIFVSGGITPALIRNLLPLGINGVAVISAILKAEDPAQAAHNFKHALTCAR
jgi:thiamine-phosphate pyrophosphorylase